MKGVLTSVDIIECCGYLLCSCLVSYLVVGLYACSSAGRREWRASPRGKRQMIKFQSVTRRWELSVVLHSRGLVDFVPGMIRSFILLSHSEHRMKGCICRISYAKVFPVRMLYRYRVQVSNSKN